MRSPNANTVSWYIIIAVLILIAIVKVRGQENGETHPPAAQSEEEILERVVLAREHLYQGLIESRVGVFEVMVKKVVVEGAITDFQVRVRRQNICQIEIHAKDNDPFDGLWDANDGVQFHYNTPDQSENPHGLDCLSAGLYGRTDGEPRGSMMLTDEDTALIHEIIDQGIREVHNPSRLVGSQLYLMGIKPKEEQPPAEQQPDEEGDEPVPDPKPELDRPPRDNWAPRLVRTPLGSTVHQAPEHIEVRGRRRAFIS